MSSEVRVLGNMNLIGSLVMGADNVDFPLNPKPGQIVIKGLNLYAFLTIGGMQTWYPMITINGGNSYIHYQAVGAIEWTVAHNLNTAEVWYQVQDASGNAMYPASKTQIDANTFVLTFASAVTGAVVVVATDQLQLNQLNASLIKVGADVVIDILGMTIGGSRVLSETAIDAKLAALPSSDPTTAIAAAIASEVTARDAAILVETSARVAADSAEVTARDSAITTAVSAEVTARDAAIAIETARAVAAEATKAGLAANTFTDDQTFGGKKLIDCMLSDFGVVSFNKGNSGVALQTINYAEGSHQILTVTGNHTIATSNWPAAGNRGELMLELINGGAFTITWPTINWIKGDGTTTTSISTYLASLTGRTALKAAGIDFMFFWSNDGGATIYGKLV